MDFNSYLEDGKFESVNCEFKELVSHKNYEKWAKTFVAFANTEGGVIFFGVNDDGIGVGILKEQLKQDILYINDICDKKIFPRIVFDFTKIQMEGDKYVLLVEVKKNLKTPVWLKRSDNEEVIYIRRDGESVIAHGDQIEDLVLLSRRVPFDTVVSNIKYSDVTFNKLEETYQSSNGSEKKITEKLLISKNLITTDGFLTNTGLLFADGNYISNSNIACRIWPGLSKGSSAMLDRKTYSGDLLSTYEFAKNYILLYTKTGLVKAENGTRYDIISYPERALNEALINAFAHRDYYLDGTQIDIDIFLDRIEISSPGKFLLPGNASEYSLRHIPSTRRNENICSVLEMCKLMEASGTGLEKIADSYEQYDEKFKPELYSDPAHFVITLKNLSYNTGRKESEAKEKINFEFKGPRSGNRKYDYEILTFCMDEPKSRSEIQEYIGLADRKSFVSSILNPLLDKELLLTTQSAINAPNQKYYTNKEKIRIIIGDSI